MTQALGEYSFLNADLRADPNHFEKGKNVGIVHSKAAVGRIGADCLIPVCSMDAVAPITKNQYRYTQWIIGPGLYQSRKLRIVFPDNRRWSPGRMENLSGYFGGARPFAPLACRP